MHVRDLAELAALLAIHAPQAVGGAGCLLPQTSEQYWTASKCRLDRWGRLLRQLSAASGEAELPPTLSWPRVRPVLEEILATEILTRLWLATATAYDAQHGEHELEPVARNIFVGHLVACHRVLSLLAEGRVIALPEAVKLNYLRRRVERWTDMLLAHFVGLVVIDDFAFQPDRARDFADDLDRHGVAAERRLTCQLVLTSLRASFSDGLAERSPNADLNRRIGTAILAVLQDQESDDANLPTSLWLQRIQRTASETEGMIEELLRLDANGVGSLWR